MEASIRASNNLSFNIDEVQITNLWYILNDIVIKNFFSWAQLIYIGDLPAIKTTCNLERLKINWGGSIATFDRNVNASEAVSPIISISCGFISLICRSFFKSIVFLMKSNP